MYSKVIDKLSIKGFFNTLYPNVTVQLVDNSCYTADVFSKHFPGVLLLLPGPLGEVETIQNILLNLEGSFY